MAASAVSAGATPPTRLNLSLSSTDASSTPAETNRITKATSPPTTTSASTTEESASPGPANRSAPAAVSSSTPRAVAIRPVAAPSPAPTKPEPVNRVAMESAFSPAPASQLSMTSKEWVIPPRPKPGRKPATDTPPTKRKAQNRAAQRAFRERRAARVGELEEQLDEQKAEHDQREHELQERIRSLEVESQTLKARCQWLERTLEKERLGRSRTNSMPSTPMQPHRSSSSLPALAPAQRRPELGRRSIAGSGLGATPIAVPRPAAQPFSISQIISPLEGLEGQADLMCTSCGLNGRCQCAEAVEKALGCGKCSFGSSCACLDEAVRSTAGSSDLKRPHSPGSPSLVPDEKRHRPSEAESPMEIDFTAMFSQKKPSRAASPVPEPQPVRQQSFPIEPKDQCGFCKDGTYCVCADAMRVSDESAEAALSLPTPQPIYQQTQTPPPSEHDVDPAPVEITSSGAIKLPSFRTLSQSRGPATGARPSTCGPGGPGTCAQCLADPKSGLFCRSLAANLERGRSGGGCCGGSGGAGGCCKLGGGPPRPPRVSASGLGLSLSCADAYKTLSSHRHFGEAASDIGDWLPKLRAAPAPPRQPGGRASVDKLAPIEVEAASIMSVLKGFDVRFGS